MKITDLPNAELLRLFGAVARSDNVEPVLASAVQAELTRRLELAAASIAKAEADRREAEYQAVCRAGRQLAAELQAQQEGQT